MPSLIDTSSKFFLSFSKREFNKLRQGSVEAYFIVVQQALDKHTYPKAKLILRLDSEYVTEIVRFPIGHSHSKCWFVSDKSLCDIIENLLFFESKFSKYDLK